MRAAGHRREANPRHSENEYFMEPNFSPSSHTTQTHGAFFCVHSNRSLRSHGNTGIRTLAVPGFFPPSWGGYPAATNVPPDYRYKAEVLIEDIPQPMQIKMAPDGRIFFNEYRGKLKIYHPDTKADRGSGCRSMSGRTRKMASWVSRSIRNLQRMDGSTVSIRRPATRGSI